jgi:hypothetical protein
MTVEFLSIASLLIRPIVNGSPLGGGTGFIIENNGTYFLVSNWHVLTGKNFFTPQQIVYEAEEFQILFWQSDGGSFKEIRLNVRDNLLEKIDKKGAPIFDIAAFQIPPNLLSQIEIHPIPLSLIDTDLPAKPAMEVSIIGYPHLITATGDLDMPIAIWKKGAIASDPEIQHKGRDFFFIDATTKCGMSGSPVVIQKYGAWSPSGGGLSVGERACKLLGIYSGRVHPKELVDFDLTSEEIDTHLGLCWKAALIKELLP